MNEEIQNGGALVSLSIQAGVNPSIPFLLLWLLNRFPALSEADAMGFVNKALDMAQAAAGYGGIQPTAPLPEERIPVIPGIGLGTGTTDRYVYGVQVSITDETTGETRIFPVSITSPQNLPLDQLEEAAKEALGEQADRYPKGFKGVQAGNSSLWEVVIASVAKGS